MKKQQSYYFWFWPFLPCSPHACSTRRIFSTSPPPNASKPPSRRPRPCSKALKTDGTCAISPPRPRSSADTTCFQILRRQRHRCLRDRKQPVHHRDESLFVRRGSGRHAQFRYENSLINYFVHPKNPDNIGSTYKGMEGDYKFTVMETSAAMVVLRGIITGNYYILTPFPRTPTGLKTWRPTGTMRKTCHSTPIPSS